MNKSGTNSSNAAAPAAAAPQFQFKRSKSELEKYSVEHPVNWEFKTGGGSGGVPVYLRLNTDGVSVSIRESNSGGAVGDIAQAGGGPIDPNQQLPDDLAPVASVHEFLKNELIDEMNSYDEQPPQVIQTGLGEGRISEFAGDRGFLGGGSVFGYRATLLRGPNALKIQCKIDSKSQFEKLKPTLERIIKSIK